MKGTNLYLARKGSDGITSSFVATRTNLFPSHNRTHAEGGIESLDWSQFYSCSDPITPIQIKMGKKGCPEETHQC